MIVDRFKNSPMTIGRGLMWILVMQAALAGVLLVTDLTASWLPRLGNDTDLLTGPTSPGDQVRRYDPSRSRPEFTPPALTPSIELPANQPTRLAFEIIDIDELGDAVFLNGPVEPGDAQRFENFISSLAEQPSRVVLNSPGGVVDEALEIGRKLRSIEADTFVLAGMGCFSSCPYILAAGGERTVSGSAAVGLHQHYYETPGYLPVFLAVEGIQHGQGDTMEYLIEMGIDLGVMLHSLRTPPDEIYVLVEDELLESKLATNITE